MGKRIVEIPTCDKCGKDIVGRLVAHTCPCCGSDICVKCQMKEDIKYKSPVQDVLRTPETASTESQVEHTPVGTEAEKPKRDRHKKTPVEGTKTSVDISTFSVKVGQGEWLSQVGLEGQVIGCESLLEGVMQILAKFSIDQKYVEDAPDSTGKREMLAILRPLQWQTHRAEP